MRDIDLRRGKIPMPIQSILEHRCAACGHGILSVIHGAGHRSSEFILAILISVIRALSFLIFFSDDSVKDFDFAIQDHGKAFSTNGFFDTGKTSTIAPLVEFPTKRIRL
jgi:hypothetical protein